MASEHVRGLQQARATFKALPAVVREHLLDARAKTAFAIVQRAKANLRKSPSIRTGALLEHVDYKVTKSSGRVVAGVRTGAGTVQPSRYDHMIEFGTRHSQAEPFMLPAAEAEAPNYLTRCKATGKDIEKDMAALGGRFL